MITLADIKQILFADETIQAAFIAKTNGCNPPISGTSFDEKWADFFDNASDRNLQLVLAPFLRARIFKYLHNEETDYAKEFKQAFIKLNGAELFDKMCDTSVNYGLNPVATDFSDLKSAFIYDRGKAIWNAVHNSDVHDNDYTINYCLKYYFLKQKFAEVFSETHSAQYAQTIWEEIHQIDHTSFKAFEEVKQAYIQDWNEELWQEHCGNVGTEPNLLHPSPGLVIASTETTLDFPAVPDPAQNFIQKKNNFIKNYGINAWNAANSHLHTQAFLLADQLKSNFIQACGNEQWSRIMSPPSHIARFEGVKESFCKKYNQKTWDLCCSESESTDLTVTIKTDFKERKERFIIESLARLGVDNAWQQSLNYPAIPVKSQETFTHFKGIFVNIWGTKEWNNYLTTHNRRGEYATEGQLKILAKIFHFRMQVTDINSTRTRTYFLDNEEPNAPVIHFYCENNIHYYIHEGGYSETIGNGDCFYNGFAQWLRLLVKGQEPRRIMVLPDPNDTDIESFLTVQKALLPPNQPDDFLISLGTSLEELHQIASAEEITINAIRKELGLTLSHVSNKAFSKFIQAKVNALNRIIEAKNLPFRNRTTLLKKIYTLAAKLGEQNTDNSNLVTLQSILLHIANTTYLPHGKDVDPNYWGVEEFKNNIKALQERASELSSQESFADLSADILATDFNCNQPKNMFSRIIHQPTYSSGTYNYNAEPEDWLSSGLCIAGIFMIIASMIFMISLFLVATLSGLTGLGLFLMQNGLASTALSLGAVIGLSAPNTAILLATGASFITGGVGFTMFKDFSPRHRPSLDSFLPNLNIF